MKSVALLKFRLIVALVLGSVLLTRALFAPGPDGGQHLSPHGAQALIALFGLAWIIQALYLGRQLRNHQSV